MVGPGRGADVADSVGIVKRVGGARRWRRWVGQADLKRGVCWRDVPWAVESSWEVDVTVGEGAPMPLFPPSPIRPMVRCWAGALQASLSTLGVHSVRAAVFLLLDVVVEDAT